MNNNKNKWLSILAAVCITAMMFAGCGEKGVENELTTSTPVDTAQTTGTPTSSPGETGTSEATQSSTSTGSGATTTPTADTSQSTYPSGGGGGGGSSVITTISSAVDSVVNSGSNDQTETVEYGTLQLMVSDRPADINDFEHLNVTLTEARVFKAGGFRYGYGYGYGYGSEEGSSGFKIIDFEDRTVDLTKLVGAKSLPISTTELPAGKYTKIELYVDGVEAELKEGGSADVKVPPGKLMITKNFDIVPGEETTFVFDINVIQKGHRNDYNLLPVISESGVVGKDLGEHQVEVVDQ